MHIHCAFQPGKIQLYNILLLHWPASLAGQCDNRMPESTLSPQSRTMNLATGIIIRINVILWEQNESTEVDTKVPNMYTIQCLQFMTNKSKILYKKSRELFKDFQYVSKVLQFNYWWSALTTSPVWIVAKRIKFREQRKRASNYQEACQHYLRLSVAIVSNDRYIG
jgi:hypothetical protein